MHYLKCMDIVRPPLNLHPRLCLVAIQINMQAQSNVPNNTMGDSHKYQLTQLLIYNSHTFIFKKMSNYAHHHDILMCTLSRLKKKIQFLNH